MAKSPDEMLASMIANFPEKTGKPLDEWLKIAKATKLSKHGEIVKHLKTEYGIGHGYANLVAHTLQQQAAPVPEGDDLVTAQYTGAKAALRPIYDAILAKVGKFGDDVEVAPKKTYVSLRRKKQFAILQPSTASRFDVGINLKGAPTTDRLLASGTFNAMVSHRVSLSSPKEVDKELIDWLKKAYEVS
jgi:hypothetical protein